ncbi:ADP-ribosylglycohydrolase family protein [Paenibacillus swuensis]|uniref:ADP-ribosylglycohydrolase family protein n=1 Tax=Paenibacillus swuensis TaxID=1178515 RepID=UPI0008387A10|nr:ADP-ribosylglycohydrolase family protein [Paenibacillus swuensis]
MLIPYSELRKTCSNRISMLETQGHEILGLQEKLDQIPDSYDALLEFGNSIIDVPMRGDFPYHEPNHLEEIREERPLNREDEATLYINEMEIRDKIYGGVYGKMLGCILGKPLEMGWTLKDIRSYLEGVDAWPLRDFVPAYSPSQVSPVRRDCMESTKGFVTHVQADDDLNYMVLGLKVLEQYGAAFRTQDMASLWKENIPYGWNWGPEHTRYCLLTNLWWNHYNSLPVGKEWDQFVALFNDGEELIGAMIRGDSFGLVNPGRMALAADMAWRDGRLTHAKTGLYAEMWVAASLAAAFHEQDPVKVVQAGINQLPRHSRYAACMREALEWSIEEKDWHKVYDRIDQKWGYLGFNGTFNESCSVVNSLVHGVDSYGHVDFEKIICTQVMQGWDCDSAGATAGCLAGVMAGYRNIPDKWLKPVNDTFYTTVAGEKETRISAFAERMYQMSRIVRASVPKDAVRERSVQGDTQNFTVKA